MFLIEPSALTLDPGIEKWAQMHKNRHKHFRWNARTAKITFAYAIVVPVAIGALAYWSEVLLLFILFIQEKAEHFFYLKIGEGNEKVRREKLKLTNLDYIVGQIRIKREEEGGYC